MNLHAWSTAASILVALAWLPIVLRFLHNYRERKNPQSLAICGAIVVLLYGNVSTYWYTVVPRDWLALTVRGIELLAVIHFYAAFWWSRRFPEARATLASIPTEEDKTP